MKRVQADQYIDRAFRILNGEKRVIGWFVLRRCGISDGSIADACADEYKIERHRMIAETEEVMAYAADRIGECEERYGSIQVELRVPRDVWEEETERNRAAADHFGNGVRSEVSMAYILHFVFQAEMQTELDAGLRLVFQEILKERFPTLWETYVKARKPWGYTPRSRKIARAAIRVQVYDVLKRNGVRELRGQPIDDLYREAEKLAKMKEEPRRRPLPRTGDGYGTKISIDKLRWIAETVIARSRRSRHDKNDPGVIGRFLVPLFGEEALPEQREKMRKVTILVPHRHGLGAKDAPSSAEIREEEIFAVPELLSGTVLLINIDHPELTLTRALINSAAAGARAGGWETERLGFDGDAEAAAAAAEKALSAGALFVGVPLTEDYGIPGPLRALTENLFAEFDRRRGRKIPVAVFFVRAEENGVSREDPRFRAAVRELGEYRKIARKVGIMTAFERKRDAESADDGTRTHAQEEAEREGRRRLRDYMNEAAGIGARIEELGEPE